MHVETDYDLARSLRVDAKAVRAARNLAKRVASGEIGWAQMAGRVPPFVRRLY